MRSMRWALVGVITVLVSCGGGSSSTSKINTSTAESLLRKIIEISEVQGVSLNDGGDLPVIGQCPMGLEFEWGAEAAGTVFCSVDSDSESESAIWVFTIDEVSISDILEAAGDVATGEFAGGEEQFACGNSNVGDPGRCVVLWKSGNFQALYIGAPGLLSDEVENEFHKNLSSFIATFESWDPSNSLFKD